ncbi:MAG: extracellular solute-binding protein [Geminicoccaceae bacterium]
MAARTLPAGAGPLGGFDQEVAAHVGRLKGDRSLRLRLLLPEGCLANVQPVAEAFRAQTGVEVDTLFAPVDDINTRLMLDEMTGADGYDLALPATFAIPDLAEAGALHPLDDFAARYQPDWLREKSLYAVGDTYDGQVYGFQTDGDAYLMFYNKAWMDDPAARERYADRFGRPLAVARTWQELDQQMAFFHEPERNRFGGALFRVPTYVVWEWWIRFHAKGVWPFDDDMNPLIDGEAGVTALKDLVRASAWLYPKAGTAGLFDNWHAFAEGNIFCNIGWGGTQKHLHNPGSAVRGNLVFAPTPGGVIDGSPISTCYFNWGWNYVVTSRSAEPEIAYLFALFASTPAQSTASIAEADGYFDPFQPDHYADPRMKDAYSEPFLTVHEACLRNAMPDLYLHGHGEYFAAINDAVMAALDGSKSAEQAMAEAAKIWRVIVHRLGYGKARRQWRRLRASYPAHLARHLKPRLV